MPVLHGGWWYVTRTIEGESYPVFCRSRDAEDPDTVILDCNAEAAGHEYFDVHDAEPSPDHTLLAWSSDVDGSERYTLRVRDLASGEDHDEITGTSSWGGVAWSAGNDWLFYARPDDQMRPYQIWRHRLGTAPGDDVLVHSEDDERFYLHVSATRSAQWIVISSSSMTSSESHVFRADEPESAPRLVRPRTTDVEYRVDDWGDRFVVLTNLDAPDFRLMIGRARRSGHVVRPRRPRARPSSDHGRAVRRPSRRPRMEGGTTAGSRAAPRRHLRGARLRRRAARSLDRRQPGVDDVHRCGCPISRSPPPSRCSTTTWRPASACCASRLRRLASTSTHTSASARGRQLTTASPSRSTSSATATRRSTARRRACSTPTAPTSIRWRRGSASLASRCSTAASSSPSSIPAAEASSVGRGTSTASCSTSATRSPTRLPPATTSSAAGFADGARLALRGGSAGGLLVGACITMRPERFTAAVAEVPFVDVVTTMSDPSLAVDRDRSGRSGATPGPSRSPATWPATRRTTTRFPPTTRRSSSPPDSTIPASPTTSRPSGSPGCARSAPASTRPLVLRTEMGAGHGGRSGRYDAWRDEARVITFLVTELAR